MRTTALLTSALLCLSACGDPEGDDNPNPDPGTETREAGLGASDRALLWVGPAEFQTQQCSNQPEWSAGIQGLADELSNAYLALGGTPAGAVELLSCSTPGVLSSCEPRNPPMVYAVNGLQYARSVESNNGVENLECVVTTHLDAVITDAGDTMTEVLTRTHTLTGPDCEFFEEVVRQESSNGFGISTCTVTYTSQMTVRDWSPR